MFKKSNRIAAMLLSGGIALGMMSGVARAETLTGTGDNVPGPTSGQVKGFLAGTPVTTYNMTVYFGDMIFTFDKGYWNGTQRVRSSEATGPESGATSATGIWYGMNGTNNLVTIESRSNAKVDISASVSKVTAAEPVTGSVEDAMSTVTLTLNGDTTAPQSWSAATTTSANTNTPLTTTIDAAEEPEGNNDPVVPTKTLTLSLSGTPKDGLQTNLTADPSTIGTITLNFAAHVEP